MSSEFGKILKVSVFGQSHGRAIGVTVDGLPAGEAVDMEELTAFMARRAARGDLSTKRHEPDTPIFLSGIENGVTCGAPLCAIIENTDTRSVDYSGFTATPRPGHADFTAGIRYGGHADMRGGGHFSGRLTAPLCIAGGIAKQFLARRGIYIGAHISSIGTICDEKFPLFPTTADFGNVLTNPIPVINPHRGEEMAEVIRNAAAESDSVGGTVECAVIGLPAGIGSPMFDGVENRLAAAIFGIPAVKALEFGAGFQSSELRGSENNDQFTVKDDKIVTETNNSGGILGGITTGMPLVFRVGFKPTPSIGKAQKTVDIYTAENATIEIKGRHDPCVVIRAVPVTEAVTALVTLDMLLEANGYGAF